MSKYTTVVIRMPEDAEGKKQVEQALNLLKPHQTAMSIEDEMTILELIEQHEDFPDYIADEARTKTAELHAQAEAVATTSDLDARLPDLVQTARDLGFVVTPSQLNK